MPKYAIPIITIHGFKGSVLSDPNGKPAWLTVSNAVGISTPNLALPLTWEDGVQDRDNLSPSHTLKKIGYLPRFLGGDIYESWLKKTEQLGPSFEFVWDWRRSVTEATFSFVSAIIRFASYVQWVAIKTDSKVQVVAHSAGCLITVAVMNKYPWLFHSVVFAAPPFKPNINGYLRLHYGDVAGVNTKILQPKVGFTFPSALVLLPTVEEYDDPDVGFIVNNRDNPQLSPVPLRGRKIEESLILPCSVVRPSAHSSGERVIIDFFNPKEWVDHGLGLAAQEYLDEEHITHLQNSLRDALKAKKAFQFKASVPYPPMAIIASKNHPTQHTAIKDGPISKLGFDVDTPPKVPGDGTVPWTAAAIKQEGVNFTVYESTLEHHKILNDPQVLEIIDKLHYLRRNDPMAILKFPAAKL